MSKFLVEGEAMAELSGWLESLARDAEQVACFRGFSLIAVKDFVEVALAQIGKEGIFWQYTDHSIRHIDAIVKLAEEILTGPEGLTPADALLITLALYFHDLGMVVTKAEFESRGETDFLQVKESLAEQYVANGKSDEVNGPDFERHAYEEYVRRNHAARIRNWVSGKNPLILGDAGNVVEAIEKLLAPLDPKFREHLGIVCESHHLDDLDNFAKYPVRYRYGATPREEGNVQFAALVLRTADLLHATRDRTPSIAFTIIAPTHPFSIMEWRKQQGVVSINAVPQRDALGNVDRSKASNTIGVTARFDDPDVFFSFTQYLDYVRRQVRQSYKWAELARLKEGARHTYAWQYIDDSFVEIPGYLRHDSRFSLDQDRILSLLTGHTLYNNSAVAVREVMQNAIDAVRLQQLMKEDPKNASIDVAWDAESRYLAFRDKGTGMSREIINEFLLNVGRSRYQEKEIRENFPGFSPISRFGIGILSTFMMSDEVEITTVAPQEDVGLRLLFRDVHSRYLIKELDKSADSICKLIGPHGTEVRMHVRSDVPPFDPLAKLQESIYFPDCRISFTDGVRRQAVGHKGPGEFLVDLLRRYGIEAIRHTETAPDPEPYEVRVFVASGSGYEVAYACKWWSYWNEWSLYFPTGPGKTTKDLIDQLGSCVEGIFVESGFFGLDVKQVLAIANYTGTDAPKTNVARNALETGETAAGAANRALRSVVGHVAREVKAMIEQRGVKLSTAIAEASFLAAPFINVMRGEKTTLDILEALRESLMDIPFLLINGPGGTTLSTGSDVLAKREATTVVSPTAKAAASLLALSASSTPMRELLKTLDPKQPPLPEETLITSSFTKNSLETILFSHMEIVRLHIYQEFNRVDATWGTLGEEEKWFLVPDRWQVLGRQIGSDMQQRISRPSELWVPMGAIASKGGDNVLAVDIRGSRYFLPNHPLSVLMGSLVAGDFRNPNIGEPLAWLFWLLVELYVAEMFTPQKGSGVAEAKKLLKYYAQRLQPGLVLEPVMPHVTQNWIDALADSPRAVFDPLLMTRGV